MPDSIHSTLSPSSAAIWLKCPPSALLNAKLPQEESEYAKEGTEAHALAEYKLKKLLGIKADDPRSSFSYLTDEMEAHTADYASFVYEKIKALKECGQNPHVMIEQRLEFSAYVPEGFGYADAVIISDDEIEIIDLKYGAGVMVDAEMNPQFLIYALGALELASALYDVKKVTLTAFQPRKENISEFSISKEDLLKWAEEVLVPSAKLVSSGGGDFSAGEHCRFCRSRFTCRKRTEYCLIAAHYLDIMKKAINEMLECCTQERIDKIDGDVNRIAALVEEGSQDSALGLKLNELLEEKEKIAAKELQAKHLEEVTDSFQEFLANGEIKEFTLD